MKKQIQNKGWFGGITLLFLFAQLFGQVASTSYYFEGEEIVFQFDSRLYEKATKDAFFSLKHLRHDHSIFCITEFLYFEKREYLPP